MRLERANTRSDSLSEREWSTDCQLNQAIFHLRRTIDPDYDATKSGSVAYVRHEGEVVSLHPELVRFDSALLAAAPVPAPRPGKKRPNIDTW